MRLAVFAALSLPWLLACEGPKAEVSPVTVLWMDWPSEVNAGEPFRTRLVVWNVCAVNPQFRAGGHADQSTVTFEPYYLIGHDQIACLTQRTPTLLSLIALDTAGLSHAFVRGFIHETATPVCGQTRVFKLESRN